MGDNLIAKGQDLNQSKEPLDDFNITDEKDLDVFYELSERTIDKVKIID